MIEGFVGFNRGELNAVLVREQCVQVSHRQCVAFFIKALPDFVPAFIIKIKADRLQA
jgi:hypothetical protein